MFCSIAILRYICRTYNVEDHWYPKDSIKQARVDEYLEWQHLNTRADCAFYSSYKVLFDINIILKEKLIHSYINMFQVLRPLMKGQPAKEHRVAQLEKKMNVTLDLIENIWLKDKKFLCGDEISISDIIGVCELDQPSEKII